MNAFFEFNRNLVMQHPFACGLSIGLLQGLFITRRHSLTDTWWIILKHSMYCGACVLLWRNGMLLVDQLELLNWRPIKLPLLCDFVRAQTQKL